MAGHWVVWTVEMRAVSLVVRKAASRVEKMAETKAEKKAVLWVTLA